MRFALRATSRVLALLPDPHPHLPGAHARVELAVVRDAGLSAYNALCHEVAGRGCILRDDISNDVGVAVDLDLLICGNDSVNGVVGVAADFNIEARHQ